MDAMTLKEAQAEARQHKMVIVKFDDEYRVKFRYESNEDLSYHTTDLEDAVGTMRFMATERTLGRI